MTKKWYESRILWGILLIIGGIAILLENLGVLPLGGLFWALILGAAGFAFISVYAGDKQQWWALIPGVALVAIAISALLDAILPSIGDILGGALVLSGLGAAFLIIYLIKREFWWAVIPAGVLFTMAAITIVDEAFPDFDSGGLFFVGIGLTFLVLALLPGSQDLRWAYIPALACIIIGVLLAASSSAYFNVIWPALLILLGLFLVVRVLLPHRTG